MTRRSNLVVDVEEDASLWDSDLVDLLWELLEMDEAELTAA